MSLEALPDELQAAIVDLLEPRDIKRFMQTSRADRALGRQATVWTVLRERHGLQPPKARATKYKTDHDVVTRMLCRLCWQRPVMKRFGIRQRPMDNHNICTDCIFASPGLWASFVAFGQADWELKRNTRRLGKLQAEINKNTESITLHKAGIAAEAARIQGT